MSEALHPFEPAPPSRAGGLAWHALWAVPFAVAALPTLAWLIERWTLGIWYSGQQGLIVPFIIAFLVWRDFEEAPPRLDQGSSWGLALLVPGLACMALDAAAGTGLWGAVGLIACIPALSMLLLGLRRTLRLAFPWTLSLFMLPIPAFVAAPVHLVLRQISAHGASVVLPLLGVPVTLQETTLLIPAGDVIVSDACSGFSTFHSLLTVALILAYLTPRASRRWVLLTLTPLLALATNTARVSGLALLVQLAGFDVLDTWLHPFSGFLAFGVSLLVLFGIAGRDALQASARR